MKNLFSISLCSLSMVFILMEPTFGISKNGKDLSSCDCSIYRQKIIDKDSYFKQTRAYSTSFKPTKRTTTSHTTYVTRPETVTPIYLSKVSFLMLPSSSTTTSHRLTKDPGKTISSTSSTSIRSTTSSTTPSTTFWSSSTTPSSYTVATFSTSRLPTSLSTFAYSKVTKFSMTSSSRGMWTRVSSSSSRPTRKYTSTTEKMRLMTTTIKSLSSQRNRLKNKLSSKEKSTFTDKCKEYCRSGDRSSLADGEFIDKYREIVIDEVPIAVDLTVTVTADYSPELDEPTSAVYKSVITHLSHLLVTMYNSTTGFQGVTIRKLRNGSIICDYTINFILKGNDSVSDSVLESLYDVEWEHAYLPETVGIIDTPSTRNIQGRQLKVVAQQFKDICSLMKHECSRQERICINDRQKGQAICVFPCSSSQHNSLKMPCLDDKCFLDATGNPKCFCETGHVCQKMAGLPALYVLSAIGVGMVMLLSLLIGLTIYLCSRYRFKSDSRSQTQDIRDIKEIIIEELKATRKH